MCSGVAEHETVTFRIAGIVDDSIVDGPGLRTTVFFQGCVHHCPGCHNPDTHAFDGGYETTVEAVYQHIKEQRLSHAVTFSGGDPFNQPLALSSLVERLKEEGYHICIYTGYVYEHLKQDQLAASILKHADLLVDGPFLEANKSLELKFRGSTNQRIIDLRKMRFYETMYPDYDEIIPWDEEGRVYV